MSNDGVRRATVCDVPSINWLYMSNENTRREPIKYDESDFTDYVKDGRSMLLVYDDGREIVGFLLAYDLVNWCYIDVLIIRPDRVRKGIGSALVRYLSMMNDGWDCIEVCYYVDQRIEGFFTGLGFDTNDAVTRWVTRDVIKEMKG